MSIAKLDLRTKEIFLFVDKNHQIIEEILSENVPKKKWFKPKNLGAILIQKSITYRNTKIGQIIGLYSKNEIKSQVYREYKESFKAKESKEELFEVE